MKISEKKYLAGCRVLLDNGIDDEDEVHTVMEALYAVLLDKDATKINDAIEEIPCCQNCVRSLFYGNKDGDCVNPYDMCDHWNNAFANFVSKNKCL